MIFEQTLRAMEPVLLVLDNAATAAQVDGLLPTAGGHRVVVTTRDTLAIPGARRLDLNVLTEADAVALLDQALREHDPEDDRAIDGAVVLVGVCGLLPLAVRIAAGLLADEPDTTCAELAAELANTPAEGFAHGETKVAPVLAASIDRLAARDPQAARLLKLLPLSPGPDISTEAAAALGELSVEAARSSLRALRHAHLVTLVERRWRLHDLIRRYLLDRLEDAKVPTKLLEYYVALAGAADKHVDALPGRPVSDVFTGQDQALAWFDAEHSALVAAVQWAATTNQPAYAPRLAEVLTRYLSWRRDSQNLLIVSQVAVDVCRDMGNRRGEGTALIDRGQGLLELRRFDEALAAYEQARHIFDEIGDRPNEGIVLNRLGLVLLELRRFHEALAALDQARRIFRQNVDLTNEGTTLNNLGLALLELHRFDEAVTAHKQDLVICQKLKDRRGEGMALANLGEVLRALDQFDEAITANERARHILHETGDRHSEGKTLHYLGLTLCDLRRFDEAVAALEQAIHIFHETRDRYGEGLALHDLGMVLANLQRYDEARRHFQEAAAAYTELGDTESAQEAHQLLRGFDDEAKGS